MLVSFSVSNCLSFDKIQTFDLIPGESTNRISEDSLIQTGISARPTLNKSAIIFGANASGKSNLFAAIQYLRTFVLESSTFSLDIDDENQFIVIPFLLKKVNLNKPSIFEIVFIENGVKYRYGLEIDGLIVRSEWLFWLNGERETELFDRKAQIVTYNKRSFSEIKDFLDADGLTLKKVNPRVSIISVLSHFEGKISQSVSNWFNNLKVINGNSNKGYQRYTIEKFEKDQAFRDWAVKFLSVFQISGVAIKEKDAKPLTKSVLSTAKNNPDIGVIVNTLQAFAEKHKVKSKELVILKGKSKIEFNEMFESEGTRKLIYMLGPMYDCSKNNKVLCIDEFDSKYHTLLSLKILEDFIKGSSSKSQIVMTAHDTNLLNKKHFGRDQIWFVDKKKDEASVIYSLIEYKEYYARKTDSFGKDYLSGKYGAIPLFEDTELLEKF